jgi:glycerophosphoryl diester phosphodiesterase
MGTLDRTFAGLSRRHSIWVHGHRGSASTHPENTLPSFLEACAAGADLLELDVWLTRDDALVVFHDEAVSDRVCTDRQGQPVPAPIPVRALTLAELARYECGRVPAPLYPQRPCFPDLPIPTLDELLREVGARHPQVGFNIEMKLPDQMPAGTPPLAPGPFAERVVALIRRHGVAGRVQVQSFNGEVVRAVRALAADLPLAYLFGGGEKDFPARTRAIGAQTAAPYLTMVTADAVKACHDLGLGVVPWTANWPEEWDPLLAAGVDGIITDRPRALIAYLEGRT